jgi:hypothetical protein
MLGKIYRGGVHRTTPETLEVNWSGPAGVTVILPGGAAALSADDGITGVVGANTFFYIIGEQLHGGVDENQIGTGSSIRLYTPRSGDLYAVRAAAGVPPVDDTPLTINAAGQFAAAGANDPVHAYLDYPSNSSLQVDLTGPTVADQLIPIKIK